MGEGMEAGVGRTRHPILLTASKADSRRLLGNEALVLKVGKACGRGVFLKALGEELAFSHLCIATGVQNFDPLTFNDGDLFVVFLRNFVHVLLTKLGSPLLEQNLLGEAAQCRLLLGGRAVSPGSSDRNLGV